MKKRLTSTPLETRRRRYCFCLRPRFLMGLTLIELLFVIIVIGALAALVLPQLATRSQRTKVAAARAFINTEIATALRFYEMDNGIFPTTTEGLDALLSKPDSARNWRGPYLKMKPIDPWGRKYQYHCPGTYNTRSYDLYSLGADGKEGKDDITNW